MDRIQHNTPRIPGRLLVLCSLMFALGFSLVPLYDALSGANDRHAKNNHGGELHKIQMGQVQRTVRVQLVAVHDENMSGRTMPIHPLVLVNPGQVAQTYYAAFNPTDRQMAVQAVLRVIPGEAAKYLQRINCFCVHQQPLRGKERRLMPLQILVSDQLPEHIEDITLSYTLLGITGPTDNHLVAMADPASGVAL